MKALATLALLGLATASEDNELVTITRKPVVTKDFIKEIIKADPKLEFVINKGFLALDDNEFYRYAKTVSLDDDNELYNIKDVAKKVGSKLIGMEDENELYSVTEVAKKIGNKLIGMDDDEYYSVVDTLKKMGPKLIGMEDDEELYSVSEVAKKIGNKLIGMDDEELYSVSEVAKKIGNKLIGMEDDDEFVAIGDLAKKIGNKLIGLDDDEFHRSGTFLLVDSLKKSGPMGSVKYVSMDDNEFHSKKPQEFLKTVDNAVSTTVKGVDNVNNLMKDINRHDDFEDDNLSMLGSILNELNGRSKSSHSMEVSDTYSNKNKKEKRSFRLEH